MGRVYSCYGRYASAPYTIKKTHIHVYCVEELCFYIRENAYFIDEAFFDKDLIVWLEEECGLSSIAKKLRAKLRQDKSAEVLTTILFEEIHYCSQEELESVTALLRNNERMSEVARLKLRGDFFLKNEKYTLAIECYNELISAITKEKDRPVLAAAYHNLGVVYARLFMFDRAGTFFKKAYDTVSKESYMVDYLATLRFSYTDDMYVKKLNIIDGAYDYSGALEKRIDEVNTLYENSSEYMNIKAIKQLKEEHDDAKYSEKTQAVLSIFKEEYREAMS